MFLGQAGGLVPCNSMVSPGHPTLRGSAATLPLCRRPACPAPVPLAETPCPRVLTSLRLGKDRLIESTTGP